MIPFYKFNNSNLIRLNIKKRDDSELNLVSFLVFYLLSSVNKIIHLIHPMILLARLKYVSSEAILYNEHCFIIETICAFFIFPLDLKYNFKDSLNTLWDRIAEIKALFLLSGDIEKIFFPNNKKR